MISGPQAYRNERDLLGELPVPADALYGIHTVRSLENFPLAMTSVQPELVHAYGEVKLAAIRLLRVVNLGGTAVGTGLAVTRLGSPPAIPVENRHA